MVANPAFATHFSVFITDDGHSTVAHVKYLISASTADERAAPIARDTAERIGFVCRAIAGQAQERSRSQRDGTRYHVAAHRDSTGYVYAITHEPPVNSLAHEFVSLMNALRNYVLIFGTPMSKVYSDELLSRLTHLENELRQ